MRCGATQDRWVMVDRSDRMWSTGEGNGKPLQCSCLENPMSSMRRQNDRILKEELPRSVAAAVDAKSLQSCPTLCDPIDGSPPGSATPGILQARTLEWAAISLSSAWKWIVKVKCLSHVRLFSNPWTAAHQAPLPMGFSRQEYWSGLPWCPICYWRSVEK